MKVWLIRVHIYDEEIHTSANKAGERETKIVVVGNLAHRECPESPDLYKQVKPVLINLYGW